MAARSSAGIGVGITITILGVACLTLFILTIVFLSKYQATQRNFTQFQTEVEDYIRNDERQTDTVQRLRDMATKSQPRKSVVTFLNDSLKSSMQTISGSANDTVQQMTDKLAKVEGASSNNLIGVIRSRDAQIADLNARLSQAEKDRTTALADLANETERVKTLIASHQKTVETMNGDIEKYKSEVTTYRDDVNRTKSMMEQEIEKARERAAQIEATLSEKNRKLEGENLQLVDRLAKLQKEKTKDILKPQSEAALVDAEIIGLNQGANQVTISRGRQDKVFLGMPFAVYSDATAIKPDPATGEYPRPKATIEIIAVGETSSTCRITSETRGNPVVRGDVVANAIYDPSKVYTFLVYGNFDANGDGVATANETTDIRAMIESWGGRVVDELSGDVDFLVLGQRPQLPPRPGAGQPTIIMQEYIRLDALAQKYDQLQAQAASTSLPVLNENRLYTLIGRRPGQR